MIHINKNKSLLCGNIVLNFVTFKDHINNKCNLFQTHKYARDGQ